MGSPAEDPEFLKRHGLADGFILFVGNDRPHKNFPRVLEAFSRLVREETYPGKLVVVGLTPNPIPAELSGRLVVFSFCPDRSWRNYIPAPTFDGPLAL